MQSVTNWVKGLLKFTSSKETTDGTPTQNRPVEKASHSIPGLSSRRAAPYTTSARSGTKKPAGFSPRPGAQELSDVDKLAVESIFNEIKNNGSAKISKADCKTYESREKFLAKLIADQFSSLKRMHHFAHEMTEKLREEHSIQTLPTYHHRAGEVIKQLLIRYNELPAERENGYNQLNFMRC